MSDEPDTSAAADEATDSAELVDPDAAVATDDAPEEQPEPAPEPDPNAVTISLNGVDVGARKGEMVIAAALRNDEYIPHFCYHPRMDPVGMCRQCFVEVEGPRGPMMVVSCMTPVADGQIVRTDTPQVRRAQEGMLELLLANHPLDCPVCDKGGECPLQDQAMSHGPGESRYREEKRHYEKPIPINDLVFLDRERCILCDRCTRFADEVAGDKLIHFIQRGNETQVMTFPDEPFASYFSGNTVQVCPVGALTAEPYRFKARPWDLAQASSTCTTCAVGCRTVVQSSRDELLRVQGVDSDAVNHGWLCDRGRFNFQANSSEHRLEAPMVRTESGLSSTSWAAALSAAARLVTDALDAGGSSAIGLLGGARGTNEDAFAWAQLADALGITHRDAQLGDGLPPELLGLERATIAEATTADTVVLLGPDLKEELPVLYLRLRDAAIRRQIKLVEFTAADSGLTRHAWRTVRHEPGEQATAVGRALADDEISGRLGEGSLVVIAGRANLAESAAATVAAVRRLLEARPDGKVLPALRRGNVVGALSLGLAPDGADRADGLATLRAAAEGKLELLILLGADPLNDCPDPDLARRALAGARRVLAIDTFPCESTKHADVVLAAAAAGEKSGTTTNIEGRVTPVAQAVTTRGTSRPDWMIAIELGLELGERGFALDHPLTTVGDVAGVTSVMAATVPTYADVSAAAADADDGVVVPVQPADLPAVEVSLGSRSSYDYRLVVARKLYDRAVGTAMSRSLAGLAPGQGVRVNPLDLDRLGVPDGDDVKVIGSRATAVLPIVADGRVPRGVAWAPFNQTGRAIEDVIDASAAAIDVRIERI